MKFVYLLLFTLVSACVTEKGESTLNDKCYCETTHHEFGDLSSAKRPVPFRVAFVSDTSILHTAHAAMAVIRDTNPDIVFHVGDFDYRDSPSRMEAFINTYFDPDFPYVYVIGNHDLLDWKRYQENNLDRLRESDLYCEGNHGVMSFCWFRGTKFLLSGIGTLCDSEDHLDYVGDKYESFPSFCLFHKVHSSYSIGQKKDEVPLEMYELCRDQGFIVITGHDHVYARNVESDVFQIGVGGKGLTPKGNTYDSDKWAVKYTLDAEFGGLVCDIELNHIDCRYVSVGGTLDAFFIPGKSSSDCVSQCPECTKSWEPVVDDGCGNKCPQDNCRYNERCSSTHGYTCVVDEKCAQRCGSCRVTPEQPTNWCGGTCDVPLCSGCRFEL